MAKLFWCAFALSMVTFALAQPDTYESLNYGIFNEINHSRRNPHRFSRYLDWDHDHRFLNNDASSNRVCLNQLDNFNDLDD